jgi:hypothetical protein
VDIQLGRAASVVRQTKPFLGYRAVVCGAVAGCAVAYMALVGLVGVVFGAVAFWIVFALSSAVVGVAVLVGLLDHPLFALLKAGHLALIAEIHTEDVPSNKISQTAWAKEQVLAHYGSAEAAGHMDGRVRRILTPMNRNLFDVDRALSATGVSGLPKGAAEWLVARANGYVSSTILAHTFRTGNVNMRDACKQALVLYAQCWQEVLRSAVLCMVAGWGFGAVATILFMVPLAIPASMAVTAAGKFVFFLIALALGVATKCVFFNPTAYSCVMASFDENCGALAIDAECEAGLEELSEAFKALSEDAKAAAQIVEEPQTAEETESPAPTDQAEPSGSSDPEESADPAKD